MTITRIHVSRVLVQSPGPGFLNPSQLAGLKRALRQLFPSLERQVDKAIDTISPTTADLKNALVALVVPSGNALKGGRFNTGPIEAAGGLPVAVLFTCERPEKRALSLMYGNCRYYYEEHCYDGRWHPNSNQPPAHNRCWPEVYAA
ncbi:MAG TPA: hypothetical protein VHP58_04830 [Alphaproteobacteria bacterium]|nr:hypothetical protein [Alphaproteobacteria bacterium]